MGLERFELSIDGSLRSVLQRDITWPKRPRAIS
jgi:hypothetical protein